MTEPRLNHVLCTGAAAAAASPAAAPPAASSASPAPAPPGLHRVAYWEWNATGNPAHPDVVLCLHGLTRQGRDFDELAKALGQHARVVCPDIAGRGQSDWLADPMAYQLPQYAADMLTLLAQLHRAAPIGRLDCLGTSMGALIAMLLASGPRAAAPGQPAPCALPVPLRRLVLNDVGPVIEWPALQRIGQYLGRMPRFDSLQQAADALWAVSTSFGPHTREQWLALSRPMLRSLPDGGLTLHYDPAIAVAYNALTQELAQAGQAAAWQLYDSIGARTLLLRGADSDLLSPASAQAMTQRGPRAQLIEFAGVGHAPTLVAAGQIAAVTRFLLADDDATATAAATATG